MFTPATSRTFIIKCQVGTICKEETRQRSTDRSGVRKIFLVIPGTGTCITPTDATLLRSQHMAMVSQVETVFAISAHNLLKECILLLLAFTSKQQRVSEPSQCRKIGTHTKHQFRTQHRAFL